MTHAEVSIKISKKTQGELKKLKIHPRQSYDEVIGILLRSFHSKAK